jgi:hypothetical protein
LFALAVVGKTGASYDAAAHRLEARGAAAADLRAPSAEVARVKAERSARAQAEKKLEAALRELGCKRDPAELAQSATVEDEQFGSDGSVELLLALPTKDLDLRRKK